MKIKVDIDVKPEEIRTLIGLPDVQGIQDDLVQYIRSGMKKGVDTVEAVTMLRQFLPESLRTASALQSMFSKGWGKIVGDEMDETVQQAVNEAELNEAELYDGDVAEKKPRRKSKSTDDQDESA